MDMKSMMKKAQEMQKQVESIQEKLESTEIKGHSCGGLIEARFNGKMRLLSISIGKELFEGKVPSDVLENLDLTELEDAILAAITNGQEKVESHVQEKMAGVTGDLSLFG